MSLMGTLAKVAIGYATARGVDHLGGGKGLGGLTGGAQVEGDNPLAKMQAQMGQMMGGGGDNPLAGMMEKLQSGGLDLSSLMGGGSATQGSGNKGGGLLSSLGAGGTDGGPGLAGLLAAAGGMAAAGGKNMGGLFDQFAQTAAPDAEETAALMLRAMIQAAKSDGGIDDAERAKIIDTVGDDADAEDIAFVQAQLAAPVDVEGLGKDTPVAMRGQVYSASLMTIRLDSQPEAQYLDALARAMDMDQASVNALHMQMGVQPLYR